MDQPTMRCAACSAELPDGSSVCTHCGATVYASKRMSLLGELEDLPEFSDGAEPAAAQGRAITKRRMLGGSALIAFLVLLAGGAFWAWRHFEERQDVSMRELRVAVEETVDQGVGPGADPVCVANGLAYDTAPVHVRIDNDATTAWMNALVDVGLYEVAPDAQAFTKEGDAVREYRPLPALADWGGSRRLCMARGVQVKEIRNVGAVEPVRFRGEDFTGVSADVVWTMLEPAPWLKTPDAVRLLAEQWPAWRGGRWQLGPEGWMLVQRRSFYLQDGRWYTAAGLERRKDLPPRVQPPL